jgi:hypothetical protein
MSIQRKALANEIDGYLTLYLDTKQTYEPILLVGAQVRARLRHRKVSSIM